MITCKELNRSFGTKEELIKSLIENKDEVIALKKSALKHSDGVSIFLRDGVAAKAGASTQPLKVGDTIKVAINTIGYLDSHNDVHIAGIWSKSAKEQNGKVYHAINHELSLGNLVAYPKDVAISVETMSWSELGKSYAGFTEVLAFASTITEKTNKDAFLAYRDAEDLQHSVRMEYVMLHLCINDPETKDCFANWTKYYPQVVNSELADERGYFWAVTEAKISKEGSTVLFGSNEVTPLLGHSTKEEPLPSTPAEPQKTFDVSAAIQKINFLS